MAQGPPGQQPPPQPPQPQWGAPPPPRRRKGWTTGRIVAVSLLGILVVLVLIGALAGEPPTESSPQATAATTAATQPPTTQASTTVATTAAPTTTAAPATTKPPMIRMPNVRNRILYEAMTELEDAGFNLDNVEYRWRLEDNGLGHAAMYRHAPSLGRGYPDTCLHRWTRLGSNRMEHGDRDRAGEREPAYPFAWAYLAIPLSG
jgi:hypothetical protein